MIKRKEVWDILDGYDQENLVIGMAATHSLIGTFHWAHQLGFETLAVVERGREKVYFKYFPEVTDHVILVDKFRDTTSPEVAAKLRKKNVLWIPHRGFTHYSPPKEYEKWEVPIVGSRNMMHLEDRSPDRYDQSDFMREAGIHIPKVFDSPDDIAEDVPVIVKVQAINPKEREFFVTNSTKDYWTIAKDKIEKNKITKKALEIAQIEEYVAGTPINLDFLVDPVTVYDVIEEQENGEYIKVPQEGRIWLVCTGDRKQTPLDGYNRLPADVQLKIGMNPADVECAHGILSLRESTLDNAFKTIEKLVAHSKAKFDPGLIAGVGVQTICKPDEKNNLIFVAYDLALRVAGDDIGDISHYPARQGSLVSGIGGMTVRMIDTARKKGALDRIVT